MLIIALTVKVYWALLYANACTKCFTCVISFNQHNNLWERYFYCLLGDLPKVTELTRGRDETQTQALLTPNDYTVNNYTVLLKFLEIFPNNNNNDNNNDDDGDDDVF